MNRINPFLWFNENAEEAVSFYLGIFKDAKVMKVSRYGKSGPGKPGSVMTIKFTLMGQEFVALNGGPQYKFTEAISFVINCKDQQEVDYYWDHLTTEGQEIACGWLKDKYGLCWQVVPEQLTELLTSEDQDKATRAMQAMMKMKKINIAALQEA